MHFYIINTLKCIVVLQNCIFMNTNQINWDNLRIFLTVARFQSVLEAANHLDIDQSTISRRLKKLEAEIGSKLFSRSAQGHTLNSTGHRLYEYAEQIESTMSTLESELGGDSQILTGQVRLGTTEGFGSFFIAKHLALFCDKHQAINVDLITLPRFINLSKHEADIAISIERPSSGPYVSCKLADYRLQVYATQEYLNEHPKIKTIQDINQHRLIGYVDEFSFSPELRYLEQLASNATVPLKSTSIVAQYSATLQGKMLGILPCFMGSTSPELIPVLPEEASIIRSFWLITPNEKREVSRVMVLWDYLREVADINSKYLMGNYNAINWVQIDSPNLIST